MFLVSRFKLHSELVAEWQSRHQSFQFVDHLSAALRRRAASDVTPINNRLDRAARAGADLAGEHNDDQFFDLCLATFDRSEIPTGVPTFAWYITIYQVYDPRTTRACASIASILHTGFRTLVPHAHKSNSFFNSSIVCCGFLTLCPTVLGSS